MKLFSLFFLLFSSISYASSVKFPEFISKQIKIVEEINEDNATKEIIKKLLISQEEFYETSMNQVMVNKVEYLNRSGIYDNEIFALQKVIKINKRAGNTYAVLRDEVALQTYLVLKFQNRMIKSVLNSLDTSTIEEYEESLNSIVFKNKEKIDSLYSRNFKDVLEIKEKSKILNIAKDNIKKFNALEDVNNDLIAYLYKVKTKMYRLNKYSKYHLISFAVYINSLEIVQVVNPYLERYGLNIIKLNSIFLLILLIYFFRKIVYVSLENYILKFSLLKDYSSDIVDKVRKPIEIVIIVININMIIYVYNDFSSYEIMTKVFNMIYGFYFTLFIYKIVNVVASVRLSKVSRDKITIKKDLVNVGIKIVNFIILIIGTLIVLFFAGVDLTAVLSGLGIGGFAVAFAAKDTISNFFGTLSILFSDVFSQGDWIEIDGHQGVVVEIGLRVTTIRTFDNALIAIPNGTFASKDVKNWNKRILGRRIKMHIGIKYDSKSEDIKHAVEEIRTMLDKHPKIATKATKYTHSYEKHDMAKLVSKDDLQGVKNNLLVYLDEFSDSSINILVYCFSKSVEWSEWLEAKEDVMHQIMAILEKNSLEFAFPSMSIYNENMNIEK